MTSSARDNGFWLFLGQLLRRPREISALAPSSAGLAQAMTEGIGPNTGRVVEFGPGTGVITRAILARGVHPADLTMFEMNADFTGMLSREFAGSTLHNLPAQEAARLCTPGVGRVISGLPLLSMPQPVRQAIVAAAFAVLKPGGQLVQFTYGPNPPIDEATMATLGLSVSRGPKIWLNLPPARVYHFHRKGEI
jgi:phosphatidylethanolamine/phosphatidyl-N-methylethanolamine N-methyltransferase